MYPLARLLCLVALGASVAACGAAKVQSNGDDEGPSPASGRGGSSSGGAGASGSGGPGLSLPDAGTTVDTGGLGTMPSTPTGPTCAEEAHDGKMVPLDVLLLLDISASMEEAAGPRSKWRAVREGLEKFVGDQRSAGFGVGLQVFPPPSMGCTKDADCPQGNLGACEDKGVCAAPAMVGQSTDLCNAASTFPGCGLATCTAYGHCSKSGLRCSPVGQPCVNSTPDDVCMTRPRFCSQQPIDKLCSVPHYSRPAVAIADLPGAEAGLKTAFAGITPQGGTPLTPAVDGALMHLQTRAASMPGRKPILVVATDGLPTGCMPYNNIDMAAAKIATAQMGAQAITTYVIGVFTMSQLQESTAALTKLAVAGGSMTPFVLTAGEDLAQKFLEALSKIRGTAVGCAFTIPTPNAGSPAIDFQKVNVRVSSPAGMEDLRYVGSADRCDATRGGWYYDVPPAMGKPTRVLLCEATCNKVKMVSTGTKVELRFGCETRVD